MRLPPRPDLSWKEDGTPVDDRVGDVYFSADDGLAESRAVFLSGCGLPQGWQDRASYTIAELGFGTGLNFLAVWHAWRQHSHANQWLNFVSFEGFPLDSADVAEALRHWPELTDLSETLLTRWPVRAKGVQQLVWSADRISLTLHTGLIEETLPQSRFKADAWFLDGFSPMKNEAMWNEKLWPMVADRSSAGARVATFTVAGAVRRGLAEAGFDVVKKPGFGRKRERLEAAFATSSDGPIPNSPSPPKVAIIGAGIAGTCLARRLVQRGADITLFERDAGPALGTSGNPLALVMPRLDAGDTVQARLLIDAYLSAIDFYQQQPGAAVAETVQRPKSEVERERFQKLLSDPPLGLEMLEALRGDGLLHKSSLALQPAILIPELLSGLNVKWQTEPNIRLSDRSVDGEEFDAIVYCSGWSMIADRPELKLKGRLGQIEWMRREAEVPASALASSAYAVASEHLRLWGATFADHDGSAPSVSAVARQENEQSLNALAPYWLHELKRGGVSSRAGVRATTEDRLPLIGALPDAVAMASERSRLERSAWKVEPDEFAVPGVFLAGGFGSRGFTWAPWAASILAANLFGDPAPARSEALSAISPNRQIMRQLKRQMAN